MKQFLYKVALFGFIILILLFVGEYSVRYLPNPYKYKHQWMLENAGEVQTLILGSSHTYYGINPDKIGNKTFNLANVSQNYEYDYFLLRKYIDQCTQLTNVIVPISYFSFFSLRFEDGKDWWYAINYKIYMDCDIHSDFSKYNLELAHPSVYFGKLKSLFSASKKLEITDYGMGTAYSIDNKLNKWEDSNAAVERHTAKDVSSLNANMKWISKIIELCYERGVALTLITPPTWYTYYENLDGEQLTKMYEMIDSLQNKYSFINYYDFLRDKRFVADDFYDCDHLSNIGADKFSKILNTLLNGKE